MARRLSSPVFVGRSDELSTLLSMAGAAASGSPSLALVGGEAGVGKSRLVAELASRSRDDGWLVLEGGAVALGTDGLPFGPIVEALRALARDVDRERIAAAAGATLPELTRLVPELSSGDHDTGMPTSQADWLQVRIFEGVLRLLGHLGEDAPVLLVIEDLHWADRSTRDLLTFLTRNAREERLLIVATFRTDELHRRHPLTSWLGEVERQPRVERIDLPRFGRPELVELLSAILGSAPPPALVESVARRSDGNAFFAEELVAADDPNARHRLPETLRDVLLVRLSGATEAAGRLVEVAAVAGREVEHEVLAAVCGLSDAEMAAALREAVASQLLVAEVDGGGERYRFRHALMQEAAYDDLLPSERRQLHAAYARAIESRPAGGGAAAASQLAELAHHWAAAHQPGRALAAAVAAGDASRDAFAFAEAARQYETAIELWDLVPPDDRPSDRDLGELFDAASAAATLVGDGSRAVALAERSIEYADRTSAPDDVERRSRTRERLGFAAWLAGETERSIRLLEEAVELLEGRPPSTAQARVLTGLAANLMLAGQARESLRFAQRAIDAARAIGDRGIESRALGVLGVDRASIGDIGGGTALLRESLAVARLSDDPTAVPRAHANLGSVLEMGGSVEEALEVTLAGVDSVQAYGSELSFGVFLEVNAATMYIEMGRYREAADLLAPRAAGVLPGVSTIHLHLTLARLSVLAGDIESAERHLAIAEAEAGGLEDAQFVTDLHAFGTEIALAKGDAAGAVAVAQRGLDRLVETDGAIVLGQLALPAMRAAADLAVSSRAGREVAAAEAAVEAGRKVLEKYRASTRRLTEQDELTAHEIGWRFALCEAELARAAGHDSPAAWAAIRPAVAARPAPYLEAYVLWREAEAHAAAGALAAAAMPLREGVTIARKIGAPLLAGAIEGLGRRLRVDLAPAPAPVFGSDRSGEQAGVGSRLTQSRAGARGDEPRDAVSSGPGDATPVGARRGRSDADDLHPSPAVDPFGLTIREREVLGLVAEGYTNKRIAETLFISESTAGVHVSNILGKLGVATRTEAATVAVRLGLDRAVTS